MATKLKNLRISKVDFVDEGANPDAHIKLTKSKGEKGQSTGENGDKNGFVSRLFGFIGKKAGMNQEEIDSAVEEVLKGNSVSFNERFNEIKNRKGVAMFRRQLENDLRRYYRVHGTNKGYILLTDFSGYYPNMNHDICKKQLSEFLDKSKLDAETITTAKFIIDGLFKTFETDVSRFSDDEIEKMYYTKIDPMMNCGVDPKLLTGEKMLRKGVDIGTQPSQDIGIIHPYKIDNCAKIVFSIEGYGRYTDDIRAISESKERLENLLEAIKKLADEIGLILNMRKTRIARIDKPFRILQIQYWLTDTGRVVKKINPKSVTRERKKLKAYKRQLDLGKIDFATVENSFKSWIASNYKIMSRLQIDNMFKLYYSLFGRRITWKKKHSRLRWLMEQALKDLPKTETTS